MNVEIEVQAFFVYGTLMPGQIAYYLIESEVDSAKTIRAEARNYYLAIRDGLPFAYRFDIRPPKDESIKKLKGFLIHPKPGRAEKLAQIIKDYEGVAIKKMTKQRGDARGRQPDDDRKRSGGLYKCEENEEITKLSGEVVKAIIYRAKGTTTRHLVERLDGEWRTADDPMLGKGFRQLVKIIDELDLKNIETPPADMDGYWEIMWKLQGIYANLHSVFERFSRFYLGAKISKRDYARKIDKLIKNKGIIDQIEIPFVKVHNAENASSRTTNTKTKPFATWHQVRNNMVHSGKDEPGDVKLLRNSLQGMVKLLATVIYSEIPELKRIHEPKQ